MVYKVHLDSEKIPSSKTILESCIGLVNIDPCSDVVTVSHFDIAKHLRESWDDFFSHHSRIELAFALVNYLSLPDFAHPSSTRDDLKSRIERYPLYAYACSSWGYHVQDAYNVPVHGSNEEYGAKLEHLRDLVKAFLKTTGLVASASQVASYLESDLHDIALNGGIEPLDLRLPNSVSSIQVAAHFALIDHVIDLIRIDPDNLDYADYNRVTALHEAARAGADNVVQLLLSKGCKVHTADHFGQTPLNYAAKAGHTKIVEMLQEEEPTSPVMVRRDSPLAQAAQNGHTKTVHSLARRASWDEVRQAICEAAETGNADTVRTLLKNPKREVPKNICLADSLKDGMPALVLALNGNHQNVVKILLENGADPNLPMPLDSDKTALHYAVEQDRVNIAKLLLDFGADINAQDTSGRNALFGAVGLPDTKAASLLLSNGIDVESSIDEDDNSVLHSAVIADSTDLLSLLLDQGLSVAKSDKPLLNIAARYGHYRAAELILNAGADVDSRGPDSVTPLMQAADGGHSRVCKLLISKHADARAIDKDGNTPLLHAVNSKDISTVTLLMFESDVNACNNASQNAFTKAMLLKHKEIATLLRRHGAHEGAMPISIESIGTAGPWHAGARRPDNPVPYPLDDIRWLNPKSGQSVSSDHPSDDQLEYPPSVNDNDLDEAKPPLAPKRSFTGDNLLKAAKPTHVPSRRSQSNT